jgi:transposase
MMHATMDEHLWKFVFLPPAIKYDSPVCRQEAITVNMAATKQEKAFCVLDYAQCKSITTVQRNFLRRFGKDSPTRKSIYDWLRKFETTGCLCKGKSPGRPRVSEENVQRTRKAFLRSPKKSIPKASRKLQIIQTTVWKVLRKHLFTSFVKSCTFNLDCLWTESGFKILFTLPASYNSKSK